MQVYFRRMSMQGKSSEPVFPSSGTRWRLRRHAVGSGPEVGEATQPVGVLLAAVLPDGV